MWPKQKRTMHRVVGPAVEGSSPSGHPAARMGTMADEPAGIPPVSNGERIAAAISLALFAALALIALDMALGGKVSARFSRECEDCPDASA